MKPWVAPEKRPSVSSATESPSPSPWSAAVTASISRMPGPPAGPSLRMTTTSPASIAPAFTAANASSSHSNTRAGPLCSRRPWPASFTTQPSGARLPRRIAKPPLGASGSVERADDLLALGLLGGVGLLADRPAGHGDRRRGCSRPASASRAATSGTPPARQRSGAT